MEPPNPAQILIDQKIVQFENSIQQLKNERNEHSSIARLPPEILGKIFAQAAYTVTGEKFSKPPSPAGRFNFSFVSQHWRSVAISTPEVWGILPDGYMEWCQVLLERSKKTDLTVAMNLLRSGSVQEKFLKEVMANHGDRLQELTMFSSSTATQQILDDLPASAPRLHTLRLIFGAVDTSLKLPDHSFSDAQLSTLELRGCYLDWKSPLLTGLRSLKLAMAANCVISMADFEEALKRMPGLEVLDFSNLNPVDGPVVFNQAIPLLSLQQLSLSSNTYGGLNMVQYLSVPVSTTVDLRCTAPLPTQTRTNAEPPWSIFSSTIRRFFSLMIGSSPGDGPRYHAVSVSRESMFVIQAWCNPWVYSSPNMARADKANFALRIYASDPCLEKVLSALPISQIKTLSLSTHLSRKFLMANFAKLPNLNTVVVNGGSSVISQLFQALTFKKKKKNNKKDTYHQVAFPHLENLIMYAVIFSEQDEVDYITVDSLQNCLMERFERGAPIQKLSIFECFDIWEDDIELLEELVVDVEWDGNELEYEDEEHEEDFDEDLYSDEDDFSGSEYGMPVYGSDDSFAYYL